MAFIQTGAEPGDLKVTKTAQRNPENANCDIEIQSVFEK